MHTATYWPTKKACKEGKKMYDMEVYGLILAALVPALLTLIHWAEEKTR